MRRCGCRAEPPQKSAKSASRPLSMVALSSKSTFSCAAPSRFSKFGGSFAPFCCSGDPADPALARQVDAPRRVRDSCSACVGRCVPLNTGLSHSTPRKKPCCRRKRVPPWLMPSLSSGWVFIKCRIVALVSLSTCPRQVTCGEQPSEQAPGNHSNDGACPSHVQMKGKLTHKAPVPRESCHFAHAGLDDGMAPALGPSRTIDILRPTCHRSSRSLRQWSSQAGSSGSAAVASRANRESAKRVS